MDRRAFLSLFSTVERSIAEKAIDDGASHALVSSCPVLYYGTLPSHGLLLSSLGADTRGTGRELYISALEAALSGVEIISYASGKGQLSVLCGAEDGEGRIHLIPADGINRFLSFSKDRMRRVLLTGGSVIFPSISGRDPSLALSLSSALSDAALVSLGNGFGKYVSSMLDEGKDAALLRSSLSSRDGRRLALEGCPVVDSFSMCFSAAKAVAHPHPEGRFSFLSERFDALRLC